MTGSEPDLLAVVRRSSGTVPFNPVGRVGAPNRGQTGWRADSNVLGKGIYRIWSLFGFEVEGGDIKSLFIHSVLIYSLLSTKLRTSEP